MEKYYTPELSEFHVGFEYYFKSSNEQSPLYYSYEEFGKYETLEEFEDQILNGNILVKYLNKEDIESCGWEYCSSSSYNITFKIKVKDEMIDFLFLTFDTDDNTIKIDDGAMYETDCRFNGTIRNISELKKLMKQLNIQ